MWHNVWFHFSTIKLHPCKGIDLMWWIVAKTSSLIMAKGLGPNLLWKLDFKTFKLEKHLSSFTFLRMKTVVTSASLKYYNITWHNTT
jgi:hypothetical protein